MGTKLRKNLVFVHYLRKQSWASYSEAQEPFSQRIHLLSGISPTNRCTELLLNIINPIIRFSQIIRLLETLPAFSITINKDDLYLIILQEL